MKFTISCLLTRQMLHTKFGLDCPSIYWEDVNARRTTNDGRQPIAIGHLSHSGDLTKDIPRSGFAPESLMFFISALLLSYLDFFKTKNDELNRWNPPIQHLFFQKRILFKQNGELRSSVQWLIWQQSHPIIEIKLLENFMQNKTTTKQSINWQ